MSSQQSARPVTELSPQVQMLLMQEQMLKTMGPVRHPDSFRPHEADLLAVISAHPMITLMELALYLWTGVPWRAPHDCDSLTGTVRRWPSQTRPGESFNQTAASWLYSSLLTLAERGLVRLTLPCCFPRRGAVDVCAGCLAALAVEATVQQPQPRRPDPGADPSLPDSGHQMDLRARRLDSIDKEGTAPAVERRHSDCQAYGAPPSPLRAVRDLDRNVQALAQMPGKMSEAVRKLHLAQDQMTGRELVRRCARLWEDRGQEPLVITVQVQRRQPVTLEVAGTVGRLIREGKSIGGCWLRGTDYGLELHARYLADEERLALESELTDRLLSLAPREDDDLYAVLPPVPTLAEVRERLRQEMPSLYSPVGPDEDKTPTHPSGPKRALELRAAARAELGGPRLVDAQALVHASARLVDQFDSDSEAQGHA